MNDELLDEHVLAIYGADRQEFVRERNRRVKALRADGHREEAAALEAHRKPTLTAWAVNQLARRWSADVEGLIALGERLRESHERAASGESSTGLRESSHRLRDRISALRDPARQVIEASGGRPEPHLDEVAQTLFAAASDPDHHERLRRGTLSTALEATGFGALDPDAAAVSAREKVAAGGPNGAGASDRETRRPRGGQQPGEKRKKQDRTKKDKQPPTKRERQQQARKEDQQRRDAARRGREQQRRAKRRRELERKLDELQGSRDRLQERVDRAEAEADDLRSRAARAAADADEQRSELSRVEQELRDVRDDLEASGP